MLLQVFEQLSADERMHTNTFEQITGWRDRSNRRRVADLVAVAFPCAASSCSCLCLT